MIAKENMIKLADYLALFGRHYLKEYVIKRLPLAILFSCIVVVLFVGDSGFFGSIFQDRANWETQQRSRSFNVKSHLKVTDLINEGYYLGKPPKYSHIKDRCEDFGGYLFLANKKLMQNILGLNMGPMGYIDYRSIQMYLWILTICLIFLPSVPRAIGILGSLVTFILYFNGTLHWQPLFHWTTIFSVITVLAVLFSIHSSSNIPRAFRMLDFFIISIFIGFLTYVRADGKFLLAAPLSVVLLLNFCYLGFSFIFRKKAQDKRISFKALFEKHRRLMSVTGLIVIVLFGTLFVTKTIVWLNVLYFERADGVSHRPLSNGHVLWHNTYIGLGINGQKNFNYEGIYNGDNVGFYHARIELEGNVSDTNLWEKAVGKMVGKILINDPMLVVSAVLLKLSVIVKKFFYSIVFFCAAMTFSLLYQRKQEYAGLHFAVIVLVVVSLASTLLTNPRHISYSFGLQASLLTSALFLLVKLDNNDRIYDSYYLNLLFKSFTILMSFIVLAASYFVVDNYLERGREAERLSAGTTSYMSFLDVYPANAAASFNSISEKKRMELGQKIAAEFGQTNLGTVHILPHGKNNPPYKLLNATWKGKVLYLLIKTEKRIAFNRSWRMPAPGKVIPINYNYKEKFKIFNKLVPMYEVILPEFLAPGVWLFYAKGLPGKLRNITLGQPNKWDVKRKVYGKNALYKIDLP